MNARHLFIGLMASSLVTHAGTIGRTDLTKLDKPLYEVKGDSLVCHNGGRYNNRPLYCNQIGAIVIAGDKPLPRLGSGSVMHGTFMAALVRGGQAKWLHDWSDITTSFRPHHIEWTLKDEAFGKTMLTLEAVPTSEGAGMALRMRVDAAQPGDRILWTFGGLARQAKSVLDVWDVTTAGRDKTLRLGFSPDDSRTNQVSLADGQLTIETSDAKLGATSGRCGAAGDLVVADASAWTSPASLLSAAPRELPIACGSVDPAGRREICWAFRAGKENAADPAGLFDSGLRRAREIAARVVVDTPDPRLNAVVGMSGAVMDGVYRKGIFTHSGMRWGVPLLGWRTVYGGTAYGWHERVRQQARTCLARQIRESTKTKAVANPKTGLSSQAPESRLFGKGRVDIYHPRHYDMQSQFFDQLIHAWRWTGDGDLEKLLRPALELHLEYIRECFDPDDDGLYESYANTWPTDDQWYSGGGTAEETSYAYNGHRAACELARRASDEESAKRHEARAARIRDSFMRKLWIPSKQYVGASIEQFGHQRLREDSWLYAIFCPIDAGMLDATNAARSLHYTEWGLERERMPYGGERVWPSNWVPSVWSLREMWPGDNYHLALAYFQTGLADEGWNILRGTFPHMAFYGPVPGDLGFPNGSTDFNDCASMFCRTVVEGLFGYRPDYPAKTVTIAPQFPGDWDHASIKTPDFSLNHRGGIYQISLSKPASLRLRLPVRAAKVTRVLVNKQPVEFRIEPSFGRGLLALDLPSCSAAEVEVLSEGRLEAGPSQVGEGTSPDLTLTRVEGDVPFYQVSRRRPKPPVRETLPAIPGDANWEMIDLSGVVNGDIRSIFKQAYLSPRPDTCSLRLATDGYSTWQMMLEPNHRPPEIRLSAPGKPITTPQGARFGASPPDKNIAFTSLWDNWPRKVSLKVDQSGEAIWLLVCGFTPPMQGRISNAELRLRYADGVEQKLELVPPLNFWSLCRFGTADYDYKRDAFALPGQPPSQVSLGENCRAMVYGMKLRPGTRVESLTLETLSPETIIGLMGASVMNPSR